MRKTLAILAFSFVLALENASTPALARMPLSPVNQNKLNAPLSQDNLLGLDDQLWGKINQPGDRQAILDSIDNSLRYLRTADAARAYRKYQGTGITRSRVQRSLTRFRQLVLSSNSPEELQAAVQREFVFYQSAGKDDRGTVFFTAYYEPTYLASRTPTAEYRYPLYRLPPGFSHWPKPQPTRAELEGVDGLQGSPGRLRGLELVWLRSRMEAFFVQIEGSAQLQMTDGTQMSVSYAGKTDYPYTSIGRELAKDGKLPLDGLTIPVMMDYFNQHPAELDNYLPRHRGFVFFQENHGAPARGAINSPLTPERSIATDKSLMPPGALALIHTRVACPSDDGKLEQRLVSRYVLDQDSGTAIKGPGRVDYYLGTGKIAGDRAGVTGGSGQLYYLLLKN